MPTNNALHAVLNIAKDLPAKEVVVGASNKYTAEEQLDQIAFYWINLHRGEPQGLTVHVVSADRDLTFDLDGGNRIPKAAERQAKTVADLRDAGIGIRRVLLAHDGTTASHDVFEWMLTMVAAEVALDTVAVPPAEETPSLDPEAIQKDRQRAVQLGREVAVLSTTPQSAEDLVRLARSRQLRHSRAAVARPLDTERQDPRMALLRPPQLAVRRVPRRPPGRVARSRGIVLRAQTPGRAGGCRVFSINGED